MKYHSIHFILNYQLIFSSKFNLYFLLAFVLYIYLNTPVIIEHWYIIIFESMHTYHYKLFANSSNKSSGRNFQAKRLRFGLFKKNCSKLCFKWKRFKFFERLRNPFLLLKNMWINISRVISYFKWRLEFFSKIIYFNSTTF